MSKRYRKHSHSSSDSGTRSPIINGKYAARFHIWLAKFTEKNVYVIITLFKDSSTYMEL